MAKPIVDGFGEQMGEGVEVIQLNLLSAVGRKAARKWGVSIVPATLLFDGQGEIIDRQMGMPDLGRLVDGILRLNSEGLD